MLARWQNNENFWKKIIFPEHPWDFYLHVLSKCLSKKRKKNTVACINMTFCIMKSTYFLQIKNKHVHNSCTYSLIHHSIHMYIEFCEEAKMNIISVKKQDANVLARKHYWIIISKAPGATNFAS